MFKVKDFVIKARPFSEMLYCSHGGNITDVPIGTFGIVEICQRNSDNIQVQFINGVEWVCSITELDLVKVEDNQKILIVDRDFQIILNCLKTDVGLLFKDLLKKGCISDMTYVKQIVSPTDWDMVSFVPTHKIPSDEFTYYFKRENSTNRNKIKIGRFIKKLLPDLSQKEVETFVDEYKSIVCPSLENCEFKMVNGDDIRFWYKLENYYSGEMGSLGNSCMRHNKCSPFLEIYSKNENKISMLILLKDSKIMGRALVWKLDKPADTIFMDRIYTDNYFKFNLFKLYAEKQGWIYREKQVFGSFEETKIVLKDGTIDNLEMIVLLDNMKFKYYPFVDTLCHFSQKENFLTNRNIDGKLGTFRSTEGDFEPGSDMVLDSLTKIYIPTEDAVYCHCVDLYTHRDNATLISNGRYCFNRDVVYSRTLDEYHYVGDVIYVKRLDDYFLTTKVFRIERNVYDLIEVKETLYVISEYHNKYILKEDAVKLVTKIDKDFNILKEDYVLTSVRTKNINDLLVHSSVNDIVELVDAS